MNLVLRSKTAPAELAKRVHKTLLELDPSQPPHSFYPLKSRVRDALERERSAAWLLGFFGLVALGLSALGIFSHLSVAVSAERPEIGIRCALGADRARIVGWIVGRGLRACGVGLMIGLLLTLLMLRLLNDLLSEILYGIDPMAVTTILWSSAAAAALLLIAAALASIPAATTGAAIDPIEALRT